MHAFWIQLSLCPQYPQGVGSKIHEDTTIHWCSSPLYEMAKQLVLPTHDFYICRFNQLRNEFQLYMLKQFMDTDIDKNWSFGPQENQIQSWKFRKHFSTCIKALMHSVTDWTGRRIKCCTGQWWHGTMGHSLDWK